MRTLSMSNVSGETQASHVADAVTAIVQVQPEHHHQQQQQHQQNHHHLQKSPFSHSHSSTAMEAQEMQENLVNLTDMQEIEEIHEDIVSIPKEVILISLVSQEQALYNPKHEHYRNTQRKDVKWLDIAENVGWSETQCKAKWKAMRDQYCRELKRSKFNAKANVKWKYFKELDFLRPYALSRNYRPRNSVNANSNNNNNTNNNSSNNNNNLTVHHNPATTLTINNIPNNLQDDDNRHKLPSIKIEAGQFNASDFVTAATTHIKNDHRLITSLTTEQLSIMQQQQQQHDGNWNYITTTTTTTTTAAAAALALARNTEIHIKTDSHSNGHSGSNNNNNNSSNHNNGDGNLQTAVTAVTTASDEALYNSFVAQITQQQNVLATTSGQLHHHQPLQQHHITTEEEDEDPIHTFLNIESYFEKELIAMIQQEDILYNSYHPNYRNVKMKLEVWDEIARKLKKTVKQCRLKWKALRDQYIREHKRLKNRENPESLPRWKHYDALSFLQKFIKHKSGESDKNLIEIPKTEIDIDIEEPCLQSPKLSPLHVSNDLQQTTAHHPQQQQQPTHLQHLQQALPSLSGPHNLNGNSNNNNSTQQVQNTLQHQLQQTIHHQHQQQLLHHQQQQQQVHQVDHGDQEDESLCAVACGDVSAYDEMDINDYIIGDGDADEDGHEVGDVEGVGVVASNALDADGEELEDDDDDDEEEEEEDIDRKSQHFPVYSPHVDSVGNSNEGHDVDEEMPQHHLEFKASHDGSLTQAQTPNSHSLSQQSVVLQQHLQQHQQQQQQQQQQHQQHIVTLDNDDNTQQQHNHHHQQQQQDHERDFADNLQTSLLNGSMTTSTTTTSASIGNEALHAAAMGLGIGTSLNVGHAAATAGGTSAATNTPAAVAAAAVNAAAEDDEVGAFFKAVAMKIRNAKMSPVAFTDLQIDILRVINGTLRNH